MKEIKFKDLDWYVLEEKEGKTKLLLKNVLDEERIKKYCEDDWYRDGKEVRHSDCVKPPFVWENSYIYKVILPNFLKDLGVDGEVTLLTKEEVESLPDEVKRCDDWYWTKSNATDSGDTYAYAWRVNNNGPVNNDVLYSTSAVRPVFYLDSTVLCSDNANHVNSLIEDVKEVCKNKVSEISKTLADNCPKTELVERVNKLTEIIKALFGE